MARTVLLGLIEHKVMRVYKGVLYLSRTGNNSEHEAIFDLHNIIEGNMFRIQLQCR